MKQEVMTERNTALAEMLKALGIRRPLIEGVQHRHKVGLTRKVKSLKSYASADGALIGKIKQARRMIMKPSSRLTGSIQNHGAWFLPPKRGEVVRQIGDSCAQIQRAAGKVGFL